MPKKRPHYRWADKANKAPYRPKPNEPVLVWHSADQFRPGTCVEVSRAEMVDRWVADGLLRHWAEQSIDRMGFHGERTHEMWQTEELLKRHFRNPPPPNKQHVFWIRYWDDSIFPVSEWFITRPGAKVITT